MVYSAYIYSIHGLYKPTNITGGYHYVYRVAVFLLWDSEVPSGNLLQLAIENGP